MLCVTIAHREVVAFHLAKRPLNAQDHQMSNCTRRQAISGAADKLGILRRAARTAAPRGRIQDCTRIVSRKGQILFPCSAGAVHTRRLAEPKSRSAASPDLVLANPLSLPLHGLGQRMQFGQLKRREFITLRP